MIDLILGQATITTTLDLSIPLTAPCPTHRPAGCRRRRRHRPAPALHRPAPVLVRRRVPARSGCSCGGTHSAGGRQRWCCSCRGSESRSARIGLLDHRALAELLTDPDTRFRAVLHDPDTGALLAVDTRTYRPGRPTPGSSAAATAACRFPGCATPADRSDIDHVTTFATGGPTDRTNLITLCRRHHRLKHHGGWTLTMTPTGVATWTNGIGQRYLTHPLDHRHLAA